MTRAWLEIQRQSGIDCRNIVPNADNPEHSAFAEGRCPGCDCYPFEVQGSDMRIHDRDTWISNGKCRQCGDSVGHIYARVSTIFGLEEDRDNLTFARCRVY